MSPHLDIGSYIGLALIAVLSTYGVLLYNNLVALKHAVARAWSNIDVLLKQRHDELPSWWRPANSTCATSRRPSSGSCKARSAVSAAARRTDVADLGAAETQPADGVFSCSRWPSLPRAEGHENFQHLQAAITGLENESPTGRRALQESVT